MIELASISRNRRGACDTRRRDRVGVSYPMPQSITLCSIHGCGKPRATRGYCSAHYSLWRRHGDPQWNSPRQRFERRIDRSAEGCWEWTGSCCTAGYGILSVDNRPRLAHRLAYEFYREMIPTGMQVLHTCDNRRCVNPDHLYLGTHDDNMRDKVRRNRCSSLKGTESPTAVLSEDQVCAIRAEYAACGVSQRVLAARFGVTQSTVSAIIRKVRWKHLLCEAALVGRTREETTG